MPNLKTKRARLDGQFSSYLSIAKSQEADQDLRKIVEVLIAEPNKIYNCKKAVETDMFLDHEESELPFDESVGCLQKIPHNLWREWLQDQFPGMHDKLKEHWQKDKTLLHKVIWWLTGWESRDPLPCPQPSKMKVIFAEKVTHFKKNPLVLLNARKVEWEGSGWFEIPALTRGFLDNEEDGGDTCSVTIQAEGAPSAKELPAFLKVSADWVLSSNWSLRGATLSTPAGSKPTYSLKLHTLWEDDPAFETWAPELEMDDALWKEKSKKKNANKGYKVSEGLASRIGRAWKA